jgi:hypothetical protein
MSSGAPRACYILGMSTEDLLAQVLRLPRHERARLAEEVLSSLEEADDVDIDAEGRVQTVEWSVARSEILRELGERRARRPAS